MGVIVIREYYYLLLLMYTNFATHIDFVLNYTTKISNSMNRYIMNTSIRSKIVKIEPERWMTVISNGGAQKGPDTWLSVFWSMVSTTYSVKIKIFTNEQMHVRANYATKRSAWNIWWSVQVWQEGWHADTDTSHLIQASFFVLILFFYYYCYFYYCCCCFTRLWFCRTGVNKVNSHIIIIIFFWFQLEFS